jgi:DNA-directed RNA polymerase alpha subunit
MSKMTYFKIRPEETEDHLEFELNNVGISMANAIRRVALAEVEIYAIDQANVKISENTAPLHNEYVSHRISLLPVNQDVAGLENLKFYISKKHTKDVPIDNDQNGIMEITTDNVQVYDSSNDTWINSKDIFTDTFLITKLNVKQKFLGEFTVSKGIAKNHARWQAVSTICYRYKVKKDLENVEYDKISLEEERDWVKRDNGDPTGFIFYLESSGVMELRLVIQKSLEIIKDKLVKFSRYIQTNSTKIGWTNNEMLDFEYEGEMHTLGNLISTIGLEQLGADDFIGYRIVHPMMDKFIMRMKLANSKSKNEHIDHLVAICGNIETQVDQMLTSWKSL